MKPMNFPERKRQRQIKALSFRQSVSFNGNSNAIEISALSRAVRMGSQRDIRTKKDRRSTGRRSLFR